MSTISKSNNSYALLAGNATFTGLIEKLPLNDISITVALTIDQPVSVVINQYRNSSEASKVSEIIQAVSIGDTGLVQVPIIGLWANISVTNTTPTNMTTTSITTFFQTTNYANINIRDLTDTRDKINMMGLSPTNTQIQIALDAEGRLITSGGGGGDASQWATFPAVADVDMDFKGLLNVNSISGLATKGLDMSADGILNLTSNNSGVVLSSKTEIVLAIQPESSPTPLPTKTLTYDVNGDLTFAEGTQNITNELGTTTSNSFTLTQSGGGTLDMNGNDILNANIISSVVDNSLDITADINLNIEAKNNISLTTATNATPNIIEYSGLGNLTFFEGEQNINNLLGVTHSQGFTLTQDGGGVITFADGTTQSTAGGGGGGGNFSTPSNQDLDMDSHKIINITELGAVAGQNIDINSGITFNAVGGSYISNVSDIVGNNVGDSDPYLSIRNLTSITTPTSTGLQVDVVGGVSFINGTNLLMNDGSISGVSSLRFSDTSFQTKAYQNPFQTTLDLNGNSVIGTQQIFGNNDMIFTAGLTNTSESSTLSLTNNGYAVAGKYSQLFLKPTGIELNTGDITAETDFKATFDMGGTLTVPSLALAVGGDGIQMNSSTIRDAKDIIGADNSTVTISSDIAVNLIADSNGTTPKTASLDTTGVFNAKSFTLYQGQGGEIKFPDNTTQTTAYQNNDLKSLTSTDGSITITYPDANTADITVTSPYSLPVATTTVLGGVKPDGTTITATVDGVISATSQGITSNTFYVNDNVNTINDVLPLMGSGDICIVSAGSFGNTTDITWNVAQTGLSGSVAPAPLSFLTTANASRFTVTATQVRIANIKFQLPVFLSGSNCVVDNCDFDSAITIGTNVTGYITLNNCEFGNTPVITVASTFTNILYFINCNFGGATLTLSQASASQVVFNNCAGFTTYPANATYVGINVLSAGSAQLSTNDIKSVSGTLRLTSELNVNSQAFTNVGTMSPPTSQQISFTNGLNIPSGSLNMRFNNIFNAGTITWTTGLTTIASASATRNLYTLSIPAFVSGANANFVMNDLGVFSTKSVTLTTGGIVTFPDATTQNTAYKNLDVQTITNTDGMLTITAPTTHGVTIQSAMKKGTATLTGSGGSPQGSYFISDTTVTANCVCVATYADAPPNNGVLSAIVTAGSGILIQSHLVSDVSPFFYMYFI